MWLTHKVGVQDLNPNSANPTGKLINWPQYSSANPQNLVYVDPQNATNGLLLEPDTFRQAQMDALTQVCRFSLCVAALTFFADSAPISMIQLSLKYPI